MDKKKKLMIASFLLAFIVLAILIIFIIKNNNVYYNVDFKTSGGSIVQSQKIKKNEKVKKPSDPTKEGYVFSYWELNGKKYDFNKKVIKNLVLKAKWTKEDEDKELITVKFDCDGGTLISDLIVEKGSKIKKPNDPEKTGYIFKGWLVDGILYDFNTEVNSDITLVASYEEEKVNTTKKENNRNSTTKQNTQVNRGSGSGTQTTNAPQTTRPTTAPTTAPTTKPTTKAVSYSYKWVDVQGSTIGQADLYIINKDTGSVVSGTATITYQNGASETVSITTGGKRFVKSAIASVSNVKGN